jgi:MoaA/NifB/PqqE/SkfB family radical SAM enzyme
MNDNFFQRRGVNLDITYRCPLECPSCQRTVQHTKYGRKVPGEDMPIEDFIKITNWAKTIHFCGQLSDPVHHPKFIDMLKITKEKTNHVSIHHASGFKKLEWYIKAFKANPKAFWHFGIDGLPHQSHMYRLNQDGEYLYDVMMESKKYLENKPIWQYIIFSYNEKYIDQAIEKAKRDGVVINLMKSSRFGSETSIYMPDKDNYIIR